MYEIIQYQNGETVVQDSGGVLVTSTSVLTEVFGIRSYQELFVQYEIMSAKYGTIHSALTTLQSNVKLLRNVWGLVTLIMGILGIASIVVGGVAIPLSVLTGIVAVATQFILNNIESPLNTVSTIRMKIDAFAGVSISTANYKEILSLTRQLRTELTDLKNHLILKATEGVSVAYYRALYIIADLISRVNADLGSKIRGYASEIEQSQQQIESSLQWLESFDEQPINQQAAAKTGTYMSLQHARLTSKQKDFDNSLDSLRSQLSEAQSQISTVANQGADVSYANSVIAQANGMLQTAQTQVLSYLFRTATSTLDSAQTLIQKAKTAASIAGIIHQAELALSEARAIIAQKVAQGANVEEAQASADTSTNYLNNAKSMLVSGSLELAAANANNALNIAQNAKLIAQRSAVPQLPKPPTEQPSVTGTSQVAPAISFDINAIGIMIAIVVAAALVATALRKRT